jgi:hypothetical protein
MADPKIVAGASQWRMNILIWQKCPPKFQRRSGFLVATGSRDENVMRVQAPRRS